MLDGWSLVRFGSIKLCIFINKIRTLHIYALWDSLACIQLVRELALCGTSRMVIVLNKTYSNAS
jgi:hypothetical protein